MCELQRFKDAQEGGIFEEAMTEIAAGKKRSHWMWFIFPQIEGLGSSPTAAYYAIKSLDEARAYLNDATLGPRLRKACEILMTLPESDPHAIFGYPDDLKLCSSMTLFDYISPDDVFGKIIDKFHDGKPDKLSLEIIKNHNM